MEKLRQMQAQHQQQQQQLQQKQLLQQKQQPAPTQIDVLSFIVEGCTDASIRRTVMGTFLPHSQNHERIVYRKTVQVDGSDVLCYYWDQRDGADYSGWWFGPIVGGDEVWAYSNTHDAEPPSAGWQAPFRTPTDAAFKLNWNAGAGQKRSAPGPPVAAVKQARVVMPHQQQQQQPQPALTMQQKLQTLRQQEQAQLQQQMAAKDDIEKRRREQVETQKQQEVQQNRVLQQQAMVKAKQQREQQKVDAEKNALVAGEKTAAQKIRNAIRMLAVQATPQTWSDLDSKLWETLDAELPNCGSLAEAVNMEADSQWKIAKDRVEQLKKKQEEDAKTQAKQQAMNSIQAALTFKCNLSDNDKQEWLGWRLQPVEFLHNVRAEINRSGVRFVNLGAMDKPKADACRLTAEKAIEEAMKLEKKTVNAKPEKEPDLESCMRTVDELTETYGVMVLVQALKEATDDVAEHIPLRVIGPPDACRDAAALLWARYVAGSDTGTLLTVANHSEQMSSMSSKDFLGDLKALAEEMQVQVRQTNILFCITGQSAESVKSAKQTLTEMLVFYAPEEFYICKGLEATEIDTLREFPGLRVLTSEPGCMVTFNPDKGEALICGSRRDEVDRCFAEALAPVGENQEQSPATA